MHKACFPWTSYFNLTPSMHKDLATRACSFQLFIIAYTFPISVPQSAISLITASPVLAGENQTHRPKITPTISTKVKMTKTHHCPGKKKKIQGLSGNCRPGAGIATGSCATHQTVCTNIVDGKYCKGKHMRNEPCRQCGYKAR